MWEKRIDTEDVVAPFAGAWIEIKHAQELLAGYFESLPSRERGLKYSQK